PSADTSLPWITIRSSVLFSTSNFISYLSSSKSLSTIFSTLIKRAVMLSLSATSSSISLTSSPASSSSTLDSTSSSASSTSLVSPSSVKSTLLTSFSSTSSPEHATKPMDNNTATIINK